VREARIVLGGVEGHSEAESDAVGRDDFTLVFNGKEGVLEILHGYGWSETCDPLGGFEIHVLPVGAFGISFVPETVDGNKTPVGFTWAGEASALAIDDGGGIGKELVMGAVAFQVDSAVANHWPGILPFGSIVSRGLVVGNEEAERGDLGHASGRSLMFQVLLEDRSDAFDIVEDTREREIANDFGVVAVLDW